MEEVFYADILFLVNFSMDYISLYFTSRISSRAVSSLRIILGAALGAVYGVFSVAFGLGGILGVILTVISSSVMILITFGYTGFPEVMRCTAVLWGCGALLGGVMTAVCALLSLNSYGTPSVSSTVLLAIGSVFSLIITRIILHSKNGTSVTVTVSLYDNKVTFEALCDSGNLVCEPLSGRPVIIASSEAVQGLINTAELSRGIIPDRLEKRIRMVPVSTLGESVVLTGFIPDSVSVKSSSRHEKKVNAIIAFADIDKEKFGGYAANVPAIIL